MIFPQIFQIVPYAREFLPIKIFSKYFLKNSCFHVPQNEPWTDEMTRVISASTGIKFSPSYLLNKPGDLSFYCIFRKRKSVKFVFPIAVHTGGRAKKLWRLNKWELKNSQSIGENDKSLRPHGRKKHFFDWNLRGTTISQDVFEQLSA